MPEYMLLSDEVGKWGDMRRGERDMNANDDHAGHIRTSDVEPELMSIATAVLHSGNPQIEQPRVFAGLSSWGTRIRT